jgi:ribosomal protein S27E
MLIKCPGQDMQSWGPDAVFDVTCGSCGEEVEFFKDEVKRRCPSCGARVLNDRLDLGCAEWCPSAAQCVGPDAPDLTDEQREALRRSAETEKR